LVEQVTVFERGDRRVDGSGEGSQVEPISGRIREERFGGRKGDRERLRTIERRRKNVCRVALIEVRTDHNRIQKGRVIGNVDPASQVGQDVAQDGRAGVGLDLDPRLVGSSVQAVDRIVDDPRDAYRRRGLVHKGCFATDTDTAAGISG